MKVYKYEDITMVAVYKSTRDHLMKLKQKYHLKNVDELIKKMILEFEYQNEEPYEKYNS